MNILQKLAVILILWLPFSLAGIAASIVSLYVILFGSREEQQGYGKNVLRAMDKVLASVCGFSGSYTLSAECGIATTQPWTGLRFLLNAIQAGHCEHAAEIEGLREPETPAGQ